MIGKSITNDSRTEIIYIVDLRKVADINACLEQLSQDSRVKRLNVYWKSSLATYVMDNDPFL